MAKAGAGVAKLGSQETARYRPRCFSFEPIIVYFISPLRQCVMSPQKGGKNVGKHQRSKLIWVGVESLEFRSKNCWRDWSLLLKDFYQDQFDSHGRLFKSPQVDSARYSSQLRALRKYAKKHFPANTSTKTRIFFLVNATGTSFGTCTEWTKIIRWKIVLINFSVRFIISPRPRLVRCDDTQKTKKRKDARIRQPSSIRHRKSQMGINTSPWL